MSIWITQLLCERHHCLHAYPWDDADQTQHGAEDRFRMLASGLGLNITRCALCDSTQIRTLHARTMNFTSVKDAAVRIAQAKALSEGTGDLLQQIGAQIERDPKGGPWTHEAH